jgi:DedD protein
MNRQALLWVILSVTLLVILILGAGLLLLRDKPTVPVAEVAKPTMTPYFDLAYQSTPLPGLVTPSPQPQQSPTPGYETQEMALGEALEGQGQAAPLPAKQAAAQPASKQAPIEEQKHRPTASRAASTPAPAPKIPSKSYWIQTGSYKSKSKADSRNAVLTENGLSGVVTPKILDGDTFFRVRLGPYANKAEAEKFLAWIKKIDGFEESYISLEFPAKN